MLTKNENLNQILSCIVSIPKNLIYIATLYQVFLKILVLGSLGKEYSTLGDKLRNRKMTKANKIR
jgi:hypothetical protein